LPSPYHRSDVVADAGAGATSAQCVDRAVEQGSGRPKSCGLYRATEIARIFGRTVRRSSLRDISPLTVLSFVASLADRAGRGGEVRADCGRGHRPDPGSSVPGRRHHHAVLVLCRDDELWSRKHGTTGFNAQLVCLLDGAAIYISGPLPGCTHDAKGISPPRRSPRLSRTPVAGSWIKAQRHQRWRSDLLCAATERETLRTRLCAATHADQR